MGGERWLITGVLLTIVFITLLALRRFMLSLPLLISIILGKYLSPKE